MNRKTFMQILRHDGFQIIGETEAKDIIDRSLKRCSWQDKTVVIMEELAELQKEVSKMYRGEGDCYAVLEEMADVYICLEFLKVMNGLTKEDVDKAVSIKLRREKERCDGQD